MLSQTTLPELARHGPWSARTWVQVGHGLWQRGRLDEAEQCYRAALDQDPVNALAHNNLGWAREHRGDVRGAILSYRRALSLDPGLGLARRNMARLLVERGQREASMSLWHAEAQSNPKTLRCLLTQMGEALQRGQLQPAADYAAIHAALRWRTPNTDPQLSVGKLVHDIEQFSYLLQRGHLPGEFSQVIRAYEGCVRRLRARRGGARDRMNPAERRAIGQIYNRLVYLRETPRVTRALSSSWNSAEVEADYVTAHPGIVVIDDFLSSAALTALRLFCLESTIWSTHRYAYGRLGSFFRDGFNCPLLMQIAEDLPRALPHVIGKRFPLRQIWGFKYPYVMPGNNTHADFAAINVNFWLTADAANLDPNSGGMTVYDAEAPMEWDFDIYNKRADLIRQFLSERRSGRVEIPYRANRAVIFNSNLFHETQPLRFRPGYDNRRVNVTFLYGDRTQLERR
jgi:Tfp pilus assembly protein PilF